MFFILIWLAALRWGGRAVPGADAAAMSKSKARIYTETSTKTTFDDVAGVDEAKEELKEVGEFLRDQATYGRLGAHVPKGVLLVGPPGTGKTLLARAVAGEAAVPFLSINGSEFVELFVGVGAARVRDLFEQGRAKAPAIIFIDELDALGRARGAYGQLAGHDEREQALNQLLSEIDGFDPSVGLVLLGATNRLEILDPARHRSRHREALSECRQLKSLRRLRRRTNHPTSTAARPRSRSCGLPRRDRSEWSVALGRS